MDSTVLFCVCSHFASVLISWTRIEQLFLIASIFSLVACRLEKASYKDIKLSFKLVKEDAGQPLGWVYRAQVRGPYWTAVLLSSRDLCLDRYSH